MSETVIITTLSGEQYEIPVKIHIDTVLSLKIKSSVHVGKPVDTLITPDGVFMEPAHALLYTFGISEGSVINASFTSLEFVSEEPEIQVIQECHYDPKNRALKRYLAPCHWQSEHGRQGPGPTFCRWRYNEKASLDIQLLVDLLHDQPVKMALIGDLLKNSDVACRSLSASWRGLEGLPGISGSVQLLEAKFGGYVVLMHLRDTVDEGRTSLIDDPCVPGCFSCRPGRVFAPC